MVITGPRQWSTARYRLIELFNIQVYFWISVPTNPLGSRHLAPTPIRPIWQWSSLNAFIFDLVLFRSRGVKLHYARNTRDGISSDYALTS